jgi:hypothetical protein
MQRVRLDRRDPGLKREWRFAAALLFAQSGVIERTIPDILHIGACSSPARS